MGKRVLGPLRRIVQRRSGVHVVIPGYKVRYFEDTMECGHVVQVLPWLEDGKPAKRHRCSDCLRIAATQQKSIVGKKPCQSTGLYITASAAGNR
jgi:hypothetical protein